jgi:beta-lactamase regulating signal transducer with metallopeptidase domain/HEAT repeat protein
VNFANLISEAASSAAFQFLLETTLKGTVLLAGAALVVRLLRGASAAYRHLVWACALVGVVALPALLAALPAWRVSAPALSWLAPNSHREPTLAIAHEPAAARDAIPSTTPEANPEAKLAEEPSGKPTTPPETRRTPDGMPALGGDALAGSGALSWPALALALWTIGAIVVLGAFVAGHLELRRLLRGTRPVRDHEWLTLAIEAAERLGLTRPVALLRGETIQMPVAVGIVRPRVLLPEGSDDWPVELRRAVLLHEFAHVQRHDCLTQSISQLACALFWFHPAVWWAATQMRSERERACDDRVLAARTRASDYADQLLHMVRSLRAKRLAALGAVAFARPSSLEGRLLAVLDPRRNRRAVGLRVAASTIVAATALVVPLAVLEPLGPHAALAARDPERPAEYATATTRPHMVSVPEPQKSLEERAAWAGTDARRSGSRAWWIGWPVETGSSFKGNNLFDSEGFDLSVLDQRGTFTLDDLLSGRARGTWNTADAPSPGTNPYAAFVLVRMKGGKADRVRVQSAGLPVDLRDAPLYWMGSVSEQQSFQWLRAAAGDASGERLRSHFVESIGYMRRSELVVPFLKGTLESTAADEVRAGAAHALQHHPSEENARLLAKYARTDRSLEVRRACVEALGNFRTPQALEELLRIARAGEGNEGLRRVAFEELGEEISRSEEGDEASDHAADVQRAQERAEEARREAREAERQDREAGPEDEASTPMPEVDLEVQRQAIESLSHYPEAQSLSRLRDIAETSPNDELRAQAVESIGRVGTPAAIEALQQIAWKNRQSQARQRAVEELGRRLPPDQAVERLSAIALRHASQDTRRTAVETAGRLESEQAFELLRKIIADGVDVDVQRQAVESLGRRVEPGVRNELLRIARKHRFIDVRRQAVESLGRLEGAGIADQLLEIVEEGGPEEIQRQAVESLGRLDADVLPALARIAQSHPVSGVRRQAVESMVRRDPDRALPLIEAILRQQKPKGT